MCHLTCLTSLLRGRVSELHHKVQKSKHAPTSTANDPDQNSIRAPKGRSDPVSLMARRATAPAIPQVVRHATPQVMEPVQQINQKIHWVTL